MAFRSRTDEYLAMRSACRATKAQSALSEDPGTRSIQIEKSKWIYKMESIRKKIENLHEKIIEMQNAIRSRLALDLSLKRDNTKEESNIAVKHANIISIIEIINNDICRNFDVTFRSEMSQRNGTNSELKILENIKKCLSQELKKKYVFAKKLWTSYEEQLKKQNISFKKWSGDEKREEFFERYEEMDGRMLQKCGTSATINVLTDERIAKQDHDDVEKIVNGMTTLQSMSSDLRFAVDEQGTVLDRIDYNMNLSHERVHETRKIIDKCAKPQKAGAFKLLALLLVILIIGFLIALIIKFSS